MEVIIVDDGSTDGSATLVKEYIRTHTLKIILVSQSNQGQGASRNRGMEEAHGSYLVFVDQDDTMAPHILPVMAAVAERQEADIVSCGYRRITESGKVIQEVWLRQEEWSKYKIIAPWGKMYRTEFIKKNNIRFLPVVLGEDIYFLMQAYAHGAKVVFMKEIAYNWLYNPHSVSNTTHRQIAEETALLNLYETLDQMQVAGQLKQDKLYEYFLIKTAIYDILLTIGSNPYEMIKVNKNRIWEWFSCHFPSYQKNPYVKFHLPYGENWKIRLLVRIYMILKRWNAEDFFLWCIHGISMMVHPDMTDRNKCTDKKLI